MKKIRWFLDNYFEHAALILIGLGCIVTWITPNEPLWLSSFFWVSLFVYWGWIGWKYIKSQ